MTPHEFLEQLLGSPHTSATGSASPGARASSGSRPEQAGLDASTNFDGNAAPVGGLIPDQNQGPPYTVKDGALSFYGVKSAAHPHVRMVERTPFPASHVNKLQKAVDTLDLGPGHYYLPLRKGKKLHGYAQFKSVPNQNKPVLTTVLGHWMSPQGQNIEHMVKLNTYEPESNATMDKPPHCPEGDNLDPRPAGSSAHTRAAPRIGESAPLLHVLRKAFNDLLMTDTNTIDQGSIAPETGSMG